jgi:hypothetical protein
MQAKRKIQLGSLVVIANGLLALSMLGSNVALASTCSGNDRVWCSCTVPCPQVSGCTLTTGTCFPGLAQCEGLPAVVCEYN